MVDGGCDDGEGRKVLLAKEWCVLQWWVVWWLMVCEEWHSYVHGVLVGEVVW